MDKVTRQKIEQKWELGYKDRGCGHGDYGIITKTDGKLIAMIRHIKNDSVQEIANHIVEIHNKTVKG